MALTLLLPLLLLSYVSYMGLKTLSHYREARKLSIPIIVTLTTWQSPLWQLLHKPLVPILSRLPFNMGAWTQYSTLGWPLADRFETHARLGPIFAIVSPYRTEYMVSDPATADILISKYRTWLKSADLYKIFDVFGKNVNSVNGEDWQRHRKITGVAFNERNNALVWAESRRQAEGMFEKWKTASNVTIRDVEHDVTVLALHVLSSATLGHSYPYNGGSKIIKQGHQLSYGATVAIIMENLMATILFSTLKLPDWLLPPSLKRLRLACAEFRAYMAEGVQEEKNDAAAGKADTRHNLMSAVVRASEIANKEDGEKSREEKRSGLSDDELYGNLFIFNLAGHETTANTFSFVIPLLAAYPEVQEWVGEEIDEVFGPYSKTSRDESPIDYDTVFPKLKRCLSLMYEQLRIFGALQALTKLAPTTTPLTIHSTPTSPAKTYPIPPDSYVSANFSALHLDPAHWGADAHEWKPQRWITPAAKSTTLSSESFTNPAPATSFVPWSGGPRVCPGKKFSQVEFIAVITYLLRRHRVRVVRLDGESEEAAKRRLMQVVRDCEFVLTPKMRRPASVKLEWVER